MKEKKILFTVLPALLAFLLVATALYRVIWVYRHYREDMLNYESFHLNSITSTAAHGMDWMLGGYENQVAQLMHRREFVGAEADYAASGDPSGIQQLIDRPEILHLESHCRVGIYATDGTLLATTSSAYPLAVEEEPLDDSLCLRVDSTGKFWLVFFCTSENSLRYELAVPLHTLFSYQANAARVGNRGYIFLMDKGGKFISFAGNGKVITQSTGDFTAGHPNAELGELLALVDKGQARPDEYLTMRYSWEGFSVRDTLVQLCPLSSCDGILFMGAAVNFQEFNSFLGDTLRDVSGIIGLGVCGLFLMVILVAKTAYDSQRSALKMQAVQERADLMEEINRQQQSLAHNERLQQLGVMTSGIVHEFNNMLTPIMSQSLLLLEQLADDEASPWFESALDIYEASESARDILLRMSAMGKKDVDMGFKTIDLCALLEKTLNLASMAKDPHIVHELILPDEMLFVSGNEQLLTQAFLNLCINACQAMGSEGTLTITADQELRSGHRYAKVEVADTGPGISDELMGSLYDPFVTTKGERGTGLGLAICQKVVETHKGTIVAANRPAGGAVFTVRIPLTDLPDDD